MPLRHLTTFFDLVRAEAEKRNTLAQETQVATVHSSEQQGERPEDDEVNRAGQRRLSHVVFSHESASSPPQPAPQTIHQETCASEGAAFLVPSYRPRGRQSYPNQG
ncbi:MAG: hypothetical protein MHM6MM_006538 [Cercozoa sp. M6MM]